MDFQEFASNSFGNDIDVYLQLIMEELKELWGVGGKTYDSALDMLSRRSTKRQLELPRKKHVLALQTAAVYMYLCSAFTVGLKEITLAFNMDFQEDETIDKSWLELPRNHPDYEAGVKNFMKFACRDLEPGEEIWCPCRRCNNKYLLNPRKVEGHS
ncbi:hypothetical protein MKW92_004487 [Papaver armeniacum]|nr:hypothetical protein MKW92_004487 [Papaver armeniacum]